MPAFSEYINSQTPFLQRKPSYSQWKNNSVDQEILLLTVLCQGQVMRIRKRSRYWWLLKEGRKEVLAQWTTLHWIWAGIGAAQDFILVWKADHTLFCCASGSARIEGDSDSSRHFQYLQGTSQSVGKVTWKLEELFSVIFGKGKNY